jgi:hypothetical protein
MSRIMNTEWKHTKTFATEANLMKKINECIADYPEYDDRFFVVRTPEGRWTAIVKLDLSKGGYIARHPFLSM